MRGNSFGHNLVMTSFGESHGPAMGVVVDGCPAGISLDASTLLTALQRRRPGLGSLTSARMEPDEPELLSGVFNGRTLGTPIAVLIRNLDARSTDYTREMKRPGHADDVWETKFGLRDPRGGGRASGRETVARVIAGAIAEKILPASVSIVGFTAQIGPVRVTRVPSELSRARVDAHETRCPDPEVADMMANEIAHARAEGDTLGGMAQIQVDGLPVGLGDPVFHKLKSELASGLMSVGAVVGVTLGDAAEEVACRGSVFHSSDADSGVPTMAHGIQGGLSNGDRIILRVYIKPVSSLGPIAKLGRHDPCLLPRIIPVLEAMTSFILADLYLTSHLDRLERESPSGIAQNS